MKQKRGRFKELLKNNLLSVILILVVLFSVVVIAGDVVVQNGQMTLEEDFIVNNSNLFVDVSSGNVGIGTLSPTQKLHVIGDGNFSESYNSLVFIDNAGQIILSDGSGSATPGIDLGWSWNGAIANISLPFATRNIDGLKIGTSSNYPVSFMMSGQPRLYLEQTTGDVGIGTAAPTHKLNVVGDVNISRTTIV